MVTGGFDSFENTDSTEIQKTRRSRWKYVGVLPYARNGLRATTVANSIYLFVRSESDVLKYEASSGTWVYYADITPEEESKLEVSTVNCSVIQHYLTNTTGAPTTIRPTSKGLSPSLHLNLFSTAQSNVTKIVDFWSYFMRL